MNQITQKPIEIVPSGADRPETLEAAVSIIPANAFSATGPWVLTASPGLVVELPFALVSSSFEIIGNDLYIRSGDELVLIKGYGPLIGLDGSPTITDASGDLLDVRPPQLVPHPPLFEADAPSGPPLPSSPSHLSGTILSVFGLNSYIFVLHSASDIPPEGLSSGFHSLAIVSNAPPPVFDEIADPVHASLPLDATPPDSPIGLTLAAADDTGKSHADNITKNTSGLTISGSGETGSTVTLFDDTNNNGVQDSGETTLATTIIVGGAAFSADIALAEGVHHVGAFQTDPAGNISTGAARLDIAVDTTAPVAPSGLDLASADDTGSSNNDDVTGNTSGLTISGTGETGATVTLFDDTNNNGAQDGGEATLATTTVASGTAFSADIALAAGLHHIGAFQTDPAGNVSTVAASLDITVDTTAPAAPASLDLAGADDSGSSNSDNVTSNTSGLTVSGTGETGATVTLFDDANNNGVRDGGEATLATTTIASGTAFSADIALTAGLHHIGAFQTDPAGNVSTGATALDITVDTTAPVAPTGLDLHGSDDTGSSNSDNVTSNASGLTISGSGETGATVTLFDDLDSDGVQDAGEATLAITTIASGTTFSADIALTAGLHHVGAFQTDPAGNVSTGAAPLDITVDAVAPSAPTGLDLDAVDDSGSSNSDNVTSNTSALTISGNGETGATVTLFDDANNNGVKDGGEAILATTTIASGTAFSTDIALAEGLHHVGAFQTDPAGNVSSGAAALAVTVDTTAPSAPTGLDLDAADDSGSANNDNVTSTSSALTVSGAGETGATVTLFDDLNNNGVQDGGEATLAITTIASGTAFAADIALADGLHHVGAFQTDPAGNVSTAATRLDIVVDTAAPSAPTSLDLDAADDTGSSSSDNVTSNTSGLTISGTGETGATVTLFDDLNNNGVQDGGEATLASTTIASGTAFFTDIALTAGLHHVGAFQTDLAGNVSTGAAALDITIDTTAPAAPTGLDLDAADDTGSSNSDNVTSNTSSLTITGTGETGATVTLFDDANNNGIQDGGEATLATATIASGTAFSADIALTAGLHHVGAFQTDPAGNVSTGATALDITVDTTAPSAPTGLDLDAADDSGSSNRDNLTNNSSALTISGSGETGATVTLFDDLNNNGVQDGGEAVLATTTIASGTTFSADIALTAGLHHVGAFQTDPAGNISVGATNLDVTVDTTAPSAPTGLDLDAADDSGSSNTDNVTGNMSALTVSGSGETGATVTLFDDLNNDGVQDSGEAVLASTTIASGTTFFADIALTSGLHHVGALQTDAAGNASGSAVGLDITVDTTAPTAPTGLDLAAVDDTGSSNTDNVTQNTSGLTIGGTGETGATVTLFDDVNNDGVKDAGEVVLATTTIVSGTAFSADIALADGLHHVGAFQTDPAGNVSTGATALDITVDTTAPAAPTALDLDAADDSGNSNSDNVTQNTSTLTISGSGETGATVALFDDLNNNGVQDGGETTLATTTIVSGTTFAADIALTAGLHHVGAVQTDAAGNVSGGATSLDITVDTTAPSAPTGLDLDSADDTGTSNSDNVTSNASSLTISGSGETGATVALFDDLNNNGLQDSGEATLATTTIASGTTFSADIALAAGLHHIGAVQTDPAGNVSGGATRLDITVDTTAPSAPAGLDLDAADDSGSSNSDDVTSNTSGLTISGSGETGATVTLFDDANNNGVQDSGESTLATATIASGTVFSADIALAEGVHHVGAFQTDPAGNVSTGAARLDITVDTTAPTAPTGIDLAAADDTGSSNADNVTSNTSGLTVSGSGETGAMVTLFDDANNNGVQDSGEATLATTTIASGTTFSADLALAEGVHHVGAFQTDPAGNVSTGATRLDITVDTTAPAAPTGLDLAAADDSGGSNTDNATSNTSGLTISGTGETGATVTLFDDTNNNGLQDSGETTLATNTIASGTAFTADIALAEGVHHVGAFQTDPAGNVSTGATRLDITVDATAPSAPSGLDLATADDTGSSNADDVTSNTSGLTISGSGETGATVTLFDDANNNGAQDIGEAALATTTIASGTTFSADITLVEGVHHVGAFQTDPAGNVSSGAARLDVTVDTTAPVAPTGLDLAATDDTGNSSTDNITSNTSGLTISGSGETGATVTLFDDANNNGGQDSGEATLATTTIASGTTFSADIALAAGLHHVGAFQTDPAGNVSGGATRLDITVDITAPSAPTGLDLAAADDTGSSSTDNVTSNTSGLTISGTGETGATVTLFDDTNNNGVQNVGEATLATTTIASGTTFSADVALAEGLHHVGAFQTDPSGNVSAGATGLDITVDTTAPSAPTALDLAAADDTGSSNTDNVTSVTSGLTVSGSGETGATVTLFDDADNDGVQDSGEATLATTTIASGTAFSADVALAEGLHHVGAFQTDPAGNVGTGAARLDITVDTTAPSALTALDLAAADDTGSSNTDNVTSNTSGLTISGSGETGATVTLFDDADNDGVQDSGEATLATTTIASGTTFSADIALTSGLHHVGGFQTDPAGNVSAGATNLDITVDTTAPVAPSSLDLAAADDTGSSNTDNVTSNTSGLTISGTGETGATVTLFDDANNNGVQDSGEATLAVTTIASGTAFSADVALTEGAHHVGAFQTDPAGNVSGGAARLDVTVDTTAPAAPSGLDLAAADDTGSSNSDNVTSNTSGLTISGSGETGATVTLFDDTNNNGVQDSGEATLATTAIASGTTFSADIALAAGTHHVGAFQTDPAGNVGTGAARLDITVDTTAPSAPTGLDLAAADDTGSSSTDNVTGTTSGLTIGGSGETGATVTLFDDTNNNGVQDSGETTLATTTIASGTTFSADVALAEGVHHVGAFQTDPAGNVSAGATNLDITIDTTAPAAPTGLDLAAADDTGSSNSDNVTSNTSGLTISGTGETGATVTLFDDTNNNGVQDSGEATLATATIASGTTFSVDIALTSGLHHVGAFQTDPAGNVSTGAARLDVTVDTTAPSAPTGLDLAAADDTGGSSTDNVTSNTSGLTISGSGETGATVTLFEDTNNNGAQDSGEATLATTTIASGTTFSADIALAAGTHHVGAFQTDLAGNVSAGATRLDIMVDTTAPAAPTGLDLAAADDTGSSSTDNVTSNTSALTISGSGETGATVTLFDDINNNGVQDGGETTLATTTIASGTTFSADVSLAAGTHHVGAFQTDPAGNVSTGATRLDITVDTTAPSAPTGLDLAAADDTGSSSTDNVTSNTSGLTISGTGETGATVTLFEDTNNNGVQDVGETTLASTTIASGTAFSADIALAAGTHHVGAFQTDPAGNVSTGAARLDITIDTTAPSAPTGLDLAAADDTGSSSTDNVTSNTSGLTISGTGETGATVTLFDDINNNGVQDGGETTLATTTIASGTTFSTDVSLAAGTHHVGAFQTDPAGNVSTGAARLDVTVDTTAPAAPTGLDLAAADDTGSSSTDNVTSNTSGLTISGAGETGATVTLFEDTNNNGVQDIGETTLASTTIASGTAFSADIALAAGTHHVGAFQTDPAGNVSTGAARLDITVDTTAPSAPTGLDLAAADDTGSSSTDNLTMNTSALTISGSGETGATVTLFDDTNNNGTQDVGETTLATATIASGTTFSGDIALTAGTHHVGAFQTDVAGNVSTGAATARYYRAMRRHRRRQPVSTLPRRMIPAAPAPTTSPRTRLASPSAVPVRPERRSHCSTTPTTTACRTSASRRWPPRRLPAARRSPATLPSPPAHITWRRSRPTLRAMSAAESARLDITVDTTAPAAPTSLNLEAADDTGSSSTDNVTKNTSALTISGTGATGATVTLFDDVNNNGTQDGGESTLVTTTIASGTSFSADIALAAGLHHVGAFQTDVAGNVSTGAARLNITVDTTAPAAIGGGYTAGTKTMSVVATDDLAGVQSVKAFDNNTSTNYTLTLGSGTSLNGTWTGTTSTDITGHSVTVTITDLAGNVFTNTSTAPAGAAGSPINLALHDQSGGHTGPVALVIAGVPDGWMLSEGTNNGNGTWSVLTDNVEHLTITSPGDYSGAVVLDVTQTWTNADGTTGTAVISDNMEAYAPGSPIFAWSGQDTLTGSAESNLFVFGWPIGNDVVHDFDAANDRIDLIGFPGLSSFADIVGTLTTNTDGDAVLTADGKTITLIGVSADALAADNFVFNQDPVTHVSGNVIVSDGAMLPLSGVVDNNGSIGLESSGDRTELEIIQPGLTLTGGGHLTLSDSDGNAIHGTGTDVRFTNVDNTISGAGQLGEGRMVLVNHGTILADGDHALVINTGDKGVVNDGTLESTGHGGLKIESDLDNAGTLWAHGGDISVSGDVTGDGSVVVDGNAILDLGGAFDGSIGLAVDASGFLRLEHSSQFEGTIAGFNEDDALDLRDIYFGDKMTASYSENQAGTGGTLTVTDGSHTANIAFDGHHALADFHVHSDGGTGTLVSLTPPELA